MDRGGARGVRVWCGPGGVRAHRERPRHQPGRTPGRGDRPVQLARDDLRLEAFGRRGAPLPAPGLSAIHRTPAGPLSVEPGQAATVHLDFAMPAGMDPDRIGALRLRWALLYDDGRRYAYYRVPVGRVIIIDRDRPRRPRR